MWGYHLTLDCAGCNNNIQDAIALAGFAADLVVALDMRAYGDPQIVRFGDDPRLTGYTLIQLIETSDITAHFCDFTGEAYIDVFSCRAFSDKDARVVVDKYFSPVAVNSCFQERQAPQIDNSEDKSNGQ